MPSRSERLCFGAVVRVKWRRRPVPRAWRIYPDGRSEPVLDRLRFNHFWSRSIADLHDKVRRGDASTPQARDLRAHLDYEARLIAIEDRAILPVARRVLAEET